MKKILLSFFFLAIATHSASAQYWSVWQKTHNITLGLSSDEKWAFFIQKNDAGVDNIYKVELKTNTVTPVTNFTERPVLGGIVLFGKPAVVYSRAASTKGDDIHLYRINVLTTDAPVDFTPKDGSSSKKILGIAYNGRYVYYLSDHGTATKTDTYRYDAAQYITELAFANDKDYETLCWSRDQTHLLLRDPKTGYFGNHNIETTDNEKLELPIKDNDLKMAFYDPMNKSFYMISKENQLSTGNTTTTGGDAEIYGNYSGVYAANLSLNGKYMHAFVGNSEKIMDISTHAFIDLPAGAYDLIIGPKEASVLYVNEKKLYLYDIAKKTSKELTTIK